MTCWTYDSQPGLCGFSPQLVDDHSPPLHLDFSTALDGIESILCSTASVFHPSAIGPYPLSAVDGHRSMIAKAPEH